MRRARLRTLSLVIACGAGAVLGQHALAQGPAVPAGAVVPQQVSERDALLAHSREVSQRLHAALPQAERDRFVLSLLRDRLDSIAEIGLDLAQRELSAGRAPAPEVAQAAAGLLERESAVVRARAATLLRALAPAGGAESGRALARSLEAERNPAAAAAMLRALTRWPTHAPRGAVLAWAEAPGNGAAPDEQAGNEARGLRGAQGAAMELLWRMIELGVLHTGPERMAALACARNAMNHGDLSELGSGGLSGVINLRRTLGDDADMAAIAALLHAESSSQRRVAAGALIFEEEHAPAVIRAAQRDAALLDAAITAMIVHGPDAESFRVAMLLPAPDQARRLLALADLARALPARDLLVLSEEVGDPLLRERLREEALTPERVLSARESPDDWAVLGLACARHARALLDAGMIARAVDVLERVPWVAEALGQQADADLRGEAYVAHGRPDLLAALGSDGGGPDPRALARGVRRALASGAAHAPTTAMAVVALIEQRGPLDPAGAQALLEIRALLPAQ